MVTTFIGIDPGKSGGIAWVSNDRMHCAPMPHTDREAFVLLEGVIDPDPFALLELVGAMPRQGLSSTFAFGQNYGLLRGLLTALECRWDTIRPQKWQAEFSLPTLNSCAGSKAVKKRFHRQKAQQLFPTLKVTNATADALLICEYARRHFQ